MKIIATALLLTACATTGRSLPLPEHSSGIHITLDPRAVAADTATPWFPALAGDAALPTAGSMERQLLASRDHFEIGLRVCVAPDGSVADVELGESSGSEDLDRAVVHDVRDWRYEPYAAPAHIRVCKPLALDYQPTPAPATRVP